MDNRAKFKDPEYSQQVCEVLYSTLSPIPNEEEYKQVWLEAPTTLLLSLVEEITPKVGKKFKFRNKKKMWDNIKEELVKSGYNFSVSQIEGKFRSLERQYKKACIHNKKTGRNRRMTVPYEDQLTRILGEKREIVPKYTLEAVGDGTAMDRITENTTSDENRSREELEEASASNCRDLGSRAKSLEIGATSPPQESSTDELNLSRNPPGNGLTYLGKIHNELKKIRRVQEAYQQEMLNHLKEKNKLAERKIQLLEEYLKKK